MTSDTLWQKFIYNTPFDDEEMPLLNSKMSIVDPCRKTITISGSSLYDFEQDNFICLCEGLANDGYGNVLIENDLHLRSGNFLVEKGAKAYLLAFCYLFQKRGFHCKITEKMHGDE